jgi:ABC-2 type transport system permease protein
MQLSAKQVWMTLIRREFLEQRLLFLYLPVVGTAVAMLLYAYVFVDRTLTDEASFLPIGPRFLAAPERIRATQIQSLYGLPGAALMFCYWLTMFFYFLTTLQQQRLNRSILFWNSMPVSDTQTVLSKLVAGLLCCHALYIACYLVLALFLMLLSLAYGWYAGVGWDVMVAPARLPQLLANRVLALPVTVLWTLPVYGWFLLASARAKRMPFIWAAAPIALIIVAEVVISSLSPPVLSGEGTMRVLRMGPGPVESWMAQAMLEHTLPFAGPDLSLLGRDLPLGAPEFPWLELGAAALLGTFFVFSAIRLNRPDET